MQDPARNQTWYNEDKVDETVLALLWLSAARLRKDEPCRLPAGTDADVLRRLEARGLIIGAPETGSAILTDEGRRSSERLFSKLFGNARPASLPAQPAGRQVEEEDGE